MITTSGRSVLRRRDGLSGTVQAGIDGLAVIGISWWLIYLHVGVITREYLLLLLLLLVILAIVYDYMAIYRSNTSFTAKTFDLFKAWSLSFLLLASIGFATRQGDTFSRLLVAQLYVAGLLSHVLLHTLFHAIQHAWFRRRQDLDHALVIGQGNLANYLAAKINNNPWTGQKLVGAVRFDLEPTDAAEDEPSALPLLGDIGQLADIVEAHDVRVVYIVTPLRASKVLEDLYFTLLEHHLSVHWIPDIYSLRLVNHSVNEIAGIPVLTLSESPLTGTRLLLKSAEDKLLALLLLLAVAPVLAAVALAVKLDSPGPVFFRQARAGWNGRNFQIWKFRSMVVHQPEGETINQAQRDDPRITRVGAFIRRTSLDELPQLFNVLTGDMSLVGPRPHAIQHDQEYSKRIQDYFARHHIKPGITGLAQVRGFRGETTDINQMVKRVQSDIEYINKWSIWLDIAILFRTVTAFTGKNAY
ncbi:undecaprenyl-phosphate glucose phosphotransferase [Mangrovimicrobium sediminis]|uniref:Undecaprenyl-phosphate glucose phosphotransferase n=1 Tax=Mangrovimicrobium sediminis TaxID=2562682 RepID=A0A4Z0M3C5_9GAMM|nr:undecaprenyl-phosphate glucose phosphotransferase [Haliea sp. SAOS-164]TGD73956.1 undecaprenyl-phosphate glucose phosphotransferase [Haliea sp. SAOS-164]